MLGDGDEIMGVIQAVRSGVNGYDLLSTELCLSSSVFKGMGSSGSKPQLFYLSTG